jgi:glycosyltransferase involved in cell wall biosynthesis
LHLIPASPHDPLSCAGDILDNLIDHYDVIHVHQCLLPGGIFMAARGRIAGKITIGTDHGGGEFHLIESYPVLGKVFDCFHAQSEFAAAAFRQMRTPIKVILGPVDETLFRSSGKNGNAGRDRRHFIALGRILPHKGYEHAIDALPERCALTIVGRRYDEAYFAFLNERAAGKDVRFESDLDDLDLASRLVSAGLYLHTGVHFSYNGGYYAKPELLALAPLEALCAGLPAIVSSAGALPELARTAGCRSYSTTQELSALLQEHVAGKLFPLSPGEIRDDAIEQYGLRQFGLSYLDLIADLRNGATV